MYACVPQSFHEKMGCIVETKLIWTAVILNGSDASGPFTNGKEIENVYVVYKIFWSPKRGLSEPP